MFNPTTPFRFRRFVLLIMFCLIASGCGEVYREEAQQYHALAQEILISKGICASESDCRSKELLFWEGGEADLGLIRWGGAYVNLYGINDPEIVEGIVAKFEEAQGREPNVPVILTVYSSNHSQPKVKLRTVVIE